MTSPAAATLRISVELSGGAELLFANVRQHQLQLDASAGAWNLRRLLAYLKEHHVRRTPELFVKGETVRPGILVLVNDSDWELLGELDYELQEGDRVAFISTLHGG